ncbi:hypothetical protein [Bradyrhizobium genosp. A]|uniref:hypothetical protein n=1 Tax=Bradyrhizobium genosp. A TaxID=83626 RepID=UPI003CF9C120
MPQIWLTYDELAALMDCDGAEARSGAAAIPLDRRKSRDGHTRVKLNAYLTEAFLDASLQQRLEQESAACASDLRTMLERMAERSAAPPNFRAGQAGKMSHG